MALIIKPELNSGIIVDNAYARIFFLNGNKTNLTIGVEYFISQEAIADGKISFKTEYYDFLPSVDDSASNFIKQGYEHLKTLPIFTGAIDIF